MTDELLRSEREGRRDKGQSSSHSDELADRVVNHVPIRYPQNESGLPDK